MKDEELKNQIFNQLKKVEKMIEIKEEKDQIEIERKKLDKLLEKYIKDI